MAGSPSIPEEPRTFTVFGRLLGAFPWLIYAAIVVLLIVVAGYVADSLHSQILVIGLNRYAVLTLGLLPLLITLSRRFPSLFANVFVVIRPRQLFAIAM